MPLPKIQLPLFELTIPSTKEKVKYRPFTVKEEKILLIAQESKDVDQVILSIKQIINNCIEGLNVDKLAMFDLEYILINLRARSVNNMIEFKIKDEDTGEEVDIELDIDDIQIKEFDGHTKVIDLENGVALGMKYPHIEQLSKLKDVKEEDHANAIFDMMMDCIETVIQDDEVYKLEDFTKTEVDEFLNDLTTEHINRLRDFFDTMPVMRFEKTYKDKTGKEKTFVAQGTETFFI